MRRAYLALFAALALFFGMILSAGAQADAGNDGVDTDCNNNFFTSQGQAQDYFAGDGGSAERNVDDLDRNNDGVACETGIRDVGGNGSQFPGGDTGTDDGTTDDGTTDDGTTDDGTTDDGTTDDGVSELPNTGVGSATSTSSADTVYVMLLASVAALLGAATLRVRNLA